MKRLITLTVLVTLCLGAWAQTGFVSGIVTDAVTNEPLIGANIYLEGTTIGTSTDLNGKYELKAEPGTYTLICSYVSYQSSSVEVTIESGLDLRQDFALELGGILGDEVVVSGSKRPEKLVESPATIETIFARQIQEYAGNPAELIARQKGIDYFRAGIATPAFNIRGFNSNFNAKNLQVTDGRYSTLIATGLPFGPLNTTIKEDIERVEVVLGPNATMYGPNAHNGLLNIVTKDPRTSEGTMITANVGLSGDGDPLYSLRLRHANKINDKLAYKIMGEYSQATEFEWADSVFIDRFDANGNRRGTPEFDDENTGGAEGYEELELDRGIDFTKLEGALYYTPTQDLEFIFNTGYSNSNYLSPTNVGRNQIIDWQVYFAQARVNYKKFFAQFYYTGSSTDDTYSIDDRTKRYYDGIDFFGLSDEEARGEFSYETGARFEDASSRSNAEIQYNDLFGNLEVIAGAQWQQDRANSNGTYLLENRFNDFWDGENIVVNQYGAYAHFTYNFNRGYKAIAAARYDYHDVYEANFVPKFGFLRVGDRGTWRLTYGEGIAAPTILNMFGNLFNGLILGNSDGFTLADGTMVPRQTVERLQTFELGYRGQLVPEKLFVDANAYYNISEDFLSPVSVVGVTTERGGQPIQDVQSGFDAFGGLVATYINFGLVNTYGADFSLNYYLSPQFSITANYSYFDWSVDEDNPENDFNNDGVVNFLDILVNAPTHKGGLGLDYFDNKFSAGLYARWVQEFDYFSSFQIASRSYPDLTYRGVPIIEDARSADTYNYGPLGGFVTFDLNVGYRFNERYQVNLSAVNLLNQELREFTAAAPTRGIYTLEFRVSLP